MPSITRLGRHALTLTAGVLIGVLFLGTAYAVTSAKFRYDKPQAGWVALSPMDFAPDSDRTASSYFNQWTPPRLSSGSDCFNAGLHPPQGAKLKKVVFYYTSGPNTDFFARVVRQKPATATGSNLALVDPADDSGTVAKVTATIPATKQQILNHKFQYGVGVCPNDDTFFHGARAHYTYRTAGD